MEEGGGGRMQGVRSPPNKNFQKFLPSYVLVPKYFYFALFLFTCFPLRFGYAPVTDTQSLFMN